MTGNLAATTTPRQVDPHEIPFWARGRNGILLSEVPTREGGRRPSFFVIGAAKAGTTSLHHYLAEHPDLWMCPYKEPHYFSSEPIRARGIEWYEGLFSGAADHQLCGEASTSYSRGSKTRDTPRRLYEYAPDAKLIYLVREPVARTRSDAMQALKYERYVLREQNIPKSVDVLVSRRPILVESSEYIVQIESYLRYFDREQLLVLLQEDLARDPQGTMARIFDFLGIDTKVRVDTSRRHNATGDFIEGLKQERVAQIARRLPAFSTLRRIIPQSIRDRIRSFASARVDQHRIIEPMSPRVTARLKDHFRPLNRRLGGFIDRDLSHWD